MNMTLAQWHYWNRERLQRICDTVALAPEPGRFFSHQRDGIRRITEVRLANYALSEIIDALWGENDQA